MAVEFEWDVWKARHNAAKHGVDFDEAATVFLDPLSLTIEDEDHSQDELRYVEIGASTRGRLLVVVHTCRGSRIRIISCRKATPRERKFYEG